MPTYDYKCEYCERVAESQRLIEDRDAYTECKECGNEMNRIVVNKVGVQFKGSGFYKTDNPK
jgi:putative FmdB family regulatory protein